MIVVHHLERSRSQRIVWLLEELGIPYEIKRYERNARTMLAPPEMRAVHRLGKSPIVVDDGAPLIESGAIIEYLVARHAPESLLVPRPGAPERLGYLTFLHFAEGSLMPLLVMQLVFEELAARSPGLVRPLVRTVTAPVSMFYVRPNLKSVFDFLEDELGAHDWFAGGAFTAADIQMSFPLEMARERGALDGSRPRLMSFIDRIHTRPAYQRAMRRIGEG